MHPSMLNKEQMMEEALEAAHAALNELSMRMVEKASLRDQFAMAALPVFLTYEIDAKTIAEYCYTQADAMMEARK